MGRTKGSTFKTDVQVFGVLFLIQEGLSFNELARQTGLSRGTVSQCLKRFLGNGYISKERSGRKEIYKLVNKTGVVYHLLDKIGDFRKVKSLFLKSHLKPSNMIPFWLAVIEEEMRKICENIDRMRLSDEDLRFVMFLEDYMMHKIPEGWLEHASFEDWFIFRFGEEIHPPSLWIWEYTLRRFPEIKDKLYSAKRISGYHGGEAYEYEFPPLPKLCKLLKEHKRIHSKVEEIRKGKKLRQRLAPPPLPRINPALFLTRNECPECGCEELIWDHEKGEVVCKSCALVIS